MDKSTLISKSDNQYTNEVNNYITSLSKEEKKTLEIAKSHLGTSFNMNKSIGFIQWQQANSKEK
jgi:hypothetical protein